MVLICLARTMLGCNSSLIGAAPETSSGTASMNIQSANGFQQPQAFKRLEEQANADPCWVSAPPAIRSESLDAKVSSAEDISCQIDLPAVMSIMDERIQTPEDFLLHMPSRILNHTVALSVCSLGSALWSKISLTH